MFRLVNQIEKLALFIKTKHCTVDNFTFTITSRYRN